jgi:hypothetical protein
VRSRTTRQFRILLDQLPDRVQRQAQQAYELFRDNPRHPGLQFKRVSGGEPAVYSARVGVQCRALGVDRGDYILWFWIGSHTEYERLLRKL